MLPNNKLLSQSSLDARARRSALRVGLVARKSRKSYSWKNQGGFMLVDSRNCLEAGPQFDMTGEDVMEYCYKS